MFEMLKSLKYVRHHKKLEEAYKFGLKHSHFQCRYCKKDLGSIDEILIVEFIQHMEDNHKEFLDMDEVERHKRLFKKLTK